MTHAEMNELYELYVLGALDLEEAAEIDSHVADQCEHCLANIHRAVQVTAELSVISDPVTPPAEVRTRLLASISRQPASEAVRPRALPARWFSWAVPLLAAACLAVALFGVYYHREASSVDSRLTRVTYERDQLRAAIEMLTRQDTRAIQFSQNGNPAHGRVLVNKGGGVVLVGSDLPSIGEDKTYELWAIPAKGNPIPAGLFRASATGDFVHIAPQPVNVSRLAAVAVSVEPRAGSPAPTTKPILVIPVT